MPTLLTLIGGLIFGGVPSNAVYDLLKTGWETATARSWESLYLDAFDAALASERPRLAKYADGDISLDRETLSRVLHNDLAAPVGLMGVGALTDEKFVADLSTALANRQALMIGGHNLSEEDYGQIVRVLVHHASTAFRASVLADPDAFQEALLTESLDNRELLRETQAYLGSHFQLMLARLDEHGMMLEKILANTEDIKKVPQPQPLAEIDASTANAAAQQSRLDRLWELTQLSRARCIARWQAAGLSREEAIALADDPLVGAPEPEYLPTPQRPLVVLVADLGAGKSLIGERLFQAALGLASENSVAPVPVYLEATDCIGRVEHAVLQQASGIGDVWQQGAAVVIDGADEAGGGANELLQECRILVNAWPQTTIVITSRPLPSFDPDICRDERMDVKLLPEEDAMALVRRVARNEHLHPYGWPQSVRDALRRPLFAILLGIYFQPGQDRRLTSAGALLQHLVERALGRTVADRAASNALLQRIAVISTDRVVAFVPTSEVTTRDQLSQLLESRLVVERDGRIGFPLAVLREWFAAHSLANGEPDLSDLIEDRARLHRWRYPIVMFVAMYDDNRVHDVIEQLAERHPGYTSEIISAALPGPHEGGEESPYTPIEWGPWIRRAVAGWSVGIGPLSTRVAPVTDTGHVRSLAIVGQGDTLWMTWYYGTDALPDIVDFWPARGGPHPDWPGSLMTHSVPHRAWAWRCTRDSIRYTLTNQLRKRSIPVTDGPLLAERFWQISRAMARHLSSWSDPIPISDVDRTLKGIGENTSLGLRGGVEVRPPEVSWYRQRIASLQADGESEIVAPYPGPDTRRRTAAHWIWDNYSDEQFLQRTAAVFTAAVEGYTQLVATWFQAFEPELATAALFPAKLVGMLVPPSCSQATPAETPGLSWYWLPLARGQQSSLCIEIGVEHSDHRELFQIMRDQVRRFRPREADWLPMSIHGTDAGTILAENPATELVYKWLEDDLRRISWVGQ
jgi:hypothetical protein